MIWANLDSMGVNTVHFCRWEREFLPEGAVCNALLFFCVVALGACGMALLAVIPKSSP